MDIVKIKRNGRKAIVTYLEDVIVGDDVLTRTVQVSMPLDMHDDFVGAMTKLGLHMAVSNDEIEVSDGSLMDLLYKSSLRMYSVSEVVINGGVEVVVKGFKRLRNGRHIKRESIPLRLLPTGENDDYPHYDELKICLEHVLSEAELYVEGKNSSGLQMKLFENGVAI